MNMSKSFQIENYLSSVDIKSRRMFTKLRTSAHSLNIETGRFSKKTRDLRICNLCNCKQIENEHHFLLKCPYYSKERLSFLKSIDFLILPRDSETKFKILMSCLSGDIELAKPICDFVKHCFDMRNEFFCNQRASEIKTKSPVTTKSGRVSKPLHRLIEVI